MSELPGAGPGPPPPLVIEAGPTPLGQYLRDMWHHRDLVRVLAVREIKLRYRQTALGATWVVLQPLLAAGILSFVFGTVAQLPSEGVPFFVFAYAGLLCWNAFSSTVARSTTSMVANASLVAKIFFPRLVLPYSSVLVVLLDFVVALSVMVVLLVTNGINPGLPLALFPVWLLLALMLAEGAGTVLASISVRYRDVPQIVPVMMQFFLYASPVAYSATAVPERYQTLYYLNPMASLLDAFRWSMVGTSAPDGTFLAYSAVVAVVAFVAGAIVLERMEGKFADVI
ncbi:MAG: ABC transporter permease [Actinomycetota bacterium]|jgi:lipopolysaccharide transport system permease protein